MNLNIIIVIMFIYQNIKKINHFAAVGFSVMMRSHGIISIASVQKSSQQGKVTLKSGATCTLGSL